MAKYSPILDIVNHYCNVDLLKHIDDDQLIKQMINTLAAAIQLPSSTAFLMGTTIFSSVATRCYRVAYPYGGDIPIGLYFVAEQPPATAKTWLQTEFQRTFDKVDDQLREDRRQRIQSLKDELENTDDKDEARKLKQELKELEMLGDFPLFITNTTPEALEVMLRQTQGAFSLVSSEQSLIDSLFGLINTNSTNQNNNEVVLNGFDSGKSGTLRISRNTYSGRAYGSVGLFAQHGSIEKVLNASNGTGLSERFLMLCERHLLGRRNHVNAPIIDRTITAQYDVIANEIAIRALDAKPTIETLTISKQGHLEINKYRDAIEGHLADGGAYAVHQSLRGTAGKINMQIMKLAANLHLLDGGIGTSEIADKHVTAAIFIVDDVLKAMLSLCHDKEIVGEKAEYGAIISYLSKRPTGRASINQIVNSLKNTKPFKDRTSNRNVAIKDAVEEMVNGQLLTEDNLGFYSVTAM